MLIKDSIRVGLLEWFYREEKPEGESDRSPLVLLHGIPSQSYSWRVLMAQLCDRGYRAIAPDWIGHGFSDKPEKREFAYTPDAYIEVLGQLFDAWELDEINIGVQGYLGSVGLQYALRNRDRVKSLLIFNAPLDPTAKLPWKMRQWGIPYVGDMLTQDPLLIDRTLEGGSGFVVQDDDLDIYRRPFLKESATGRALNATVQNLRLAQATEEIKNGLEKWDKPAQIIWGEADPWLKLDAVESLVQTNNNIKLEKLPEAKHYPQEHWGKEIGEIVMRFLRSI
ncbi:MAG: alpha/beta fold hydrolase [Cyanobacteria bacterium P01_E01_bin.42]